MAGGLFVLYERRNTDSRKVVISLSLYIYFLTRAMPPLWVGGGVDSMWELPSNSTVDKIKHLASDSGPQDKQNLV